MQVVGGSSRLCLPKREVNLIHENEIYHTSIGTVNSKKLSLREVLLSILLDRIVTTLIGLTPSLATYLKRPEPAITKPTAEHSSVGPKGLVLLGAEPAVVMARRVGSQVTAPFTNRKFVLAGDTGTFLGPSGLPSYARQSAAITTLQNLAEGKVKNSRKARVRGGAPIKTEGFVMASHVWTKDISNYGKVKRFALAKPNGLLSRTLGLPRQPKARFLLSVAEHEQAKQTPLVPAGPKQNLSRKPYLSQWNKANFVRILLGPVGAERGVAVGLLDLRSSIEALRAQTDLRSATTSGYSAVGRARQRALLGQRSSIEALRALGLLATPRAGRRRGPLGLTFALAKAVATQAAGLTP